MKRLAQATTSTVILAVSVAWPVAGSASGPGERPASVTVRADQPIAVLDRNAVGVNTPIWNPNLVHPAVSDLIRRPTRAC